LLACHVTIVPRFWRRSIARAAGAWGLRELLPGRLHAEPGVLPGRLLPAVIELLNELMTGTAAGTLPGVWLKDGGSATPPRDDAFGERQRHSIRWQLGL
jgi:hypothetical protein